MSPIVWVKVGYFCKKKSNTVIFAILQFKNVVLKKSYPGDLTRPDLTLRKRKKNRPDLGFRTRSCSYF
jgi:hypothetical protein